MTTKRVARTGNPRTRKHAGGVPSIERGVIELRNQLEKGEIQKGYRALISYIQELRTHFAQKYGASAVSGLYQGYLDMTYFALCLPALQRHNLKVAIVFNYAAFRFEAWLAARNRNVQRQYWELLRREPLPGYRVVAPAKGIDSIVECDLTNGADIGNPDALTSIIDTATTVFIESMERSLTTHAAPKST